MNTLVSGSAILSPVSIAIRAAALVCGFTVPHLAFCELSDQAMIGPGLRTRPAYDGSATQRAELVPVVRYCGDPWFVRSTQGVLEARRLQGDVAKSPLVERRSNYYATAGIAYRF